MPACICEQNMQLNIKRFAPVSTAFLLCCLISTSGRAFRSDFNDEQVEESKINILQVEYETKLYVSWLFTPLKYTYNGNANAYLAT